ncbi:MAG: ADP-forming succinate--CoA ligase subunit beta [Saprospiraceae bacterium]|nr:ADP-forming succinate--CoA ligase subunit beta [Saprospiraceae bacterium]MBP9209685.1 ADP-forming succinate--CoA ligase subunit beta [Saprospiraceae bacterium]
MNLHEYQGKSILQQFGIAVQRGVLVEKVNDIEKAYDRLVAETDTHYVVVKAQIHAGGRGKGGGIKLAKSSLEVSELAASILGMQLKTPQTPGGMEGEGKLVRKIFLAEDSYAPDFDKCKEYYFSVLTDRGAQKNVIVYSPQGGMDIEKVAEETPELVYKEFVDPAMGMMDFQARKIAFRLGLEGKAFKEMGAFVKALYKLFVEKDLTLAEINPTLINATGGVVAVDCKISIDDNALYRHPELEAMRDESEEDPAELEARSYHLNYVKLDGNVGCMVNGAGLAMATMDIIKLSGGNPANFLDVGGTADAQRVEQAFRIILKDPAVKAILVNIFGGIVRCDRVAQGIVDAYRNMGNISVPIIVRLQGTNAELAKEMIDASGLKVHSAIALQDAADLVKSVLSE